MVPISFPRKPGRPAGPAKGRTKRLSGAAAVISEGPEPDGPHLVHRFGSPDEARAWLDVMAQRLWPDFTLGARVVCGSETGRRFMTVRSTYLEEDDSENALVITEQIAVAAIDVDPDDIAEVCYGYRPKDGIWPASKRSDVPALARLAVWTRLDRAVARTIWESR